MLGNLEAVKVVRQDSRLIKFKSKSVLIAKCNAQKTIITENLLQAIKEGGNYQYLIKYSIIKILKSILIAKSNAQKIINIEVKIFLEILRKYAGREGAT